MAAPRFPFRGSREAPVFDGTPLTVNRYFQDIDQLFDNLGINAPTDAAKIQKTTYYLDPHTADLWECVQPIGGAMTWAEFKDAIRALYPGSDRSRLYSVRDLDNTVHQYAMNGVYTRAELGEYCREFKRISNYLRSQNRIDDGACNRLFIQGFGDATRRRIESRLLFTQPDHHPDDPYPEAVVRTTAEFLLSATSAAAPIPTPATTIPTAAGSLPGVPQPNTVAIKQEPLPYDQIIAKIEALSLLVNQQQSGSTNSSSPASGNRCHFCGKLGCRIAACPDVDIQIKAGTVARSADGKVTLPSGAYLPRSVTGRNLAEKFAKFHADNPGQRAVTQLQSVKMYETVDTMVHIEVADEDSEDDAEEDLEDLARVFAAEASKRFDRGKKRTTNTSQKAAEPTKPALILPPPTKPKEPTTKIDTATKPDPAFHFASPCDSHALITQVWNKTLDASITVTPQELLAVSTDLRKRYREFTTTKRVPGPHRSGDSVLFDMLLSQITTDDDGNYVADDSAPLRTMRARLGNTYEYDCIIDNGSSIVAISKDVWTQLGAPARSDLIMRMESSHGTVEKTIGVLKNYPVTVGSESFFIQVQVSENLPCEVLLGRPFFMLASATTTDHPDGSQEITLVNPNSHRQITVATKERARKKKQTEGF